MSIPDPPAQVVTLLAVSKRQRIGFDLAWRGALAKYRKPHNTPTRLEWVEILDELRWAFELTYTDAGDIRGASALNHLAGLAAVDDRDHQAKAVRIPPVYSFDRSADKPKDERWDKPKDERWDFANGRKKRDAA